MQNRRFRPFKISPAALAALQSYPFPGNVRELENILERAMAMAESNLIEVDDLNLEKGNITQKAPPQEQSAFASGVNSVTNTEPASAINPLDIAGQEKNAITLALEQTRWNKTAAAKLLGLSLRQLRYRLDKLKIE